MLLSWGSVQQDIGQRVARRTMHAVASRSLAFGCVTYRDFCWGVICNEDMSTCLRVHQPAILEDFPASCPGHGCLSVAAIFLGRWRG